nr:immunoglobulin heavy chain junction region [Mus musculus]
CARDEAQASFAYW